MSGVITIILINKEKIKSFVKISLTPIKEVLEGYYNYINANQFDDLKCPCCKRKGFLKFHKCYERNLEYEENNIIYNEIIKIAVLKCTYCKTIGNCQKYHALLPEFILPYHIYESSLIINSIYDYITQKRKLNDILNHINITHKLFYDWIVLINKYSFSSSIILKVNDNISIIVKEIYKINHKFLIEFYQNYDHPFFLNRITCVPLAIMS